MPNKFDLVVLGSGTAASSIASQCRAVGWRVAVVDRHPFGGTCALRGCVPKKVMAHAVSVVDASGRIRDKGIAAPAATIQWPALKRFARSFTESIPERTERDFQRQGIACYHGAACFVGPRKVRIGDAVLTGRHIAIATGAEPARLPIDGAEHLATSDDFLVLHRMPSSVVFVGGGYIAFEFSHVAACAGAKVTILQRGQLPLKNFDPDIVAVLVERTRRLGVNIHLDQMVTRVEKTGEGYMVHSLRDGGRASFEADLAVHSAGRRPAIQDLDLKAGQVQVEDGRVKVDERLRSVSNDAVHVAGDAAQRGPALTPVAALDAQIVVNSLLGRNAPAPSYRSVPSVVFTSPPLARVGLSEAQARAQLPHLKIKSEATSSWFSAKHTGELCAGYKTLVDAAADRIVGAHLMGPEAHEAINLFALAIQHDIPASALRQEPLAFPTSGYDLRSML
jgi:glutathione reductase (NADPH)